MRAFLLALLVAVTLTASAGARGQATKVECNPPLPYSCTTVRMAVATFSQAYLERKGREKGMTACQKQQAIACMKGAQ